MSCYDDSENVAEAKFAALVEEADIDTVKDRLDLARVLYKNS